MNLAWAKEWMANFNGSGLEKTMAMYADDVQFEDCTLGHKENSRAALTKFFGGFFTPDMGEHDFVVTGYTGNADAGAAEWTWRSKHGAEFMGIPAAGKSTETRGVSILTFRKGLVASQHDYWDMGAILRQLGAVKK